MRGGQGGGGGGLIVTKSYSDWGRKDICGDRLRNRDWVKGGELVRKGRGRSGFHARGDRRKEGGGFGGGGEVGREKKRRIRPSCLGGGGGKERSRQ